MSWHQTLISICKVRLKLFEQPQNNKSCGKLQKKNLLVVHHCYGYSHILDQAKDTCKDNRSSLLATSSLSLTNNGIYLHTNMWQHSGRTPTSTSQRQGFKSSHWEMFNPQAACYCVFIQMYISYLYSFYINTYQLHYMYCIFLKYSIKKYYF